MFLETVKSKIIGESDTLASSGVYYASNVQTDLVPDPLINEVVKVVVALLVGLLTKGISNLFNRKKEN